MTRTASSFAVALFSIAVISPWLPAGVEIEIPLSSHGGLFSVEDAAVPDIFPPPQPQCWVASLEIFDPRNDHVTSSEVCELWEGQASPFYEFKAWTASVMTRWKLHAQDQKQQYEAWLLNQTNLLSKHSREFEPLHLEKFVAAAIEFLQPLLIVQTWLSMAKYGIKSLVATLCSVVAIRIVCLVTSPRRCRGPRACLLVLVALEGVAEQFLGYAVHNGTLLDAQHHVQLSRMRQAALYLATLVYLGGLILSCCCSSSDDNEDDNDAELEDSRSGSSDNDDNEIPPRQQKDEMPTEYCGLVVLGRVTGRNEPLTSTPNATRCGTPLARGAVPLEQVIAPTSNATGSHTFSTASSRAGIVRPIAKNARQVAAASPRSKQAGLTVDVASTGIFTSTGIPIVRGMLKDRLKVAAATPTSTQAGVVVDVVASTGHLTSNGVPTGSSLTSTSAAAPQAPVNQYRGSHKRFWSDTNDCSFPDDEGAEEADLDTKRRRFENPK